MTPDGILAAAVALVGLIFSGFGLVLWSKIDRTDAHAERLDRELADFKLYVAREHPNNARLNEIVKALTGQFEQLFERLGAIEGDIRGMSDSFRDRLGVVEGRAGIEQPHRPPASR